MAASAGLRRWQHNPNSSLHCLSTQGIYFAQSATTAAGYTMRTMAADVAAHVAAAGDRLPWVSTLARSTRLTHPASGSRSAQSDVCMCIRENQQWCMHAGGNARQAQQVARDAAVPSCPWQGVLRAGKTPDVAADCPDYAPNSMLCTELGELLLLR